MSKLLSPLSFVHTPTDLRDKAGSRLRQAVPKMKAETCPFGSSRIMGQRPDVKLGIKFQKRRKKLALYRLFVFVSRNFGLNFDFSFLHKFLGHVFRLNQWLIASRDLFRAFSQSTAQFPTTDFLPGLIKSAHSFLPLASYTASEASLPHSASNLSLPPFLMLRCRKARNFLRALFNCIVALFCRAVKSLGDFIYACRAGSSLYSNHCNTAPFRENWSGGFGRGG